LGASKTLFDSFELQMEEGLANILDEDDPPSVAVAASATQSFQSIIGCDLTRIFMDDTEKKPKKAGLSLDDKNAIAVPSWSLDSFQYTRRNIGKTHENTTARTSAASSAMLH
jgi:hypothetical protein